MVSQRIIKKQRKIRLKAHLEENSPITVTTSQLSEQFQLAQPTIRQLLREMEKWPGAIIYKEKDGLEVYWHVDIPVYSFAPFYIFEYIRTHENPTKDEIALMYGFNDFGHIPERDLFRKVLGEDKRPYRV